MHLECTPILDRMEALYELPRTPKRFETYLQLLQGNTKGELVLPIGGYNPMGKDHVLEKVRELKTLHAEELVADELIRVIREIDASKGPTFEVVINVADDFGGAWTDRYTSDYSSKFEIQALVNRKFCTPYFWTGENYSEALIRSRTRNYAFRTYYWSQLGKPKSLTDHLQLELNVQAHVNQLNEPLDPALVDLLKAFVAEHAASEDYNLLFNFFYGDAASEALGYQSYGIPEMGGFYYAKQLTVNSH